MDLVNVTEGWPGNDKMVEVITFHVEIYFDNFHSQSFCSLG